MSFDFREIGLRLRAHRLGQGLSASDIAEKLGVSRAAVYRLEKGAMVKIETLERVSALLNVSLPSLLGVGVEYYSNAISFFERMRQIEDKATSIIGNFSPMSFLLLSDEYTPFLRRMLMESVQDDAEKHALEEEDYIDSVLGILDERRRSAARRRISVVSIIGTADIERFLRNGLIGRFDLPPDEARERREAARREIERIAATMVRQPMGVQVGVLRGSPPSQTFQVFERDDAAVVTLSPYRLGDQPNISAGIAMVTSAPEAVGLFRDTISSQWERAAKGTEGAAILRAILSRTPA